MKNNYHLNNLVRLVSEIFYSHFRGMNLFFQLKTNSVSIFNKRVYIYNNFLFEDYLQRTIFSIPIIIFHNVTWAISVFFMHSEIFFKCSLFIFLMVQYVLLPDFTVVCCILDVPTNSFKHSSSCPFLASIKYLISWKKKSE